VTTQPVRYLVYSHSAFDHSTGGAVFSDTARFVGHKNTVDRIKAANDPTTPVPDIVFDKKTTLELGGRVVDLYPADLSPTDDYIVVHYPAGRVAMFVDLVQPRNVPFRTLLGHPERIVERLQWLEDKLEFDVIVSGHATPQMSGTKQDVVEQRVYYRDLSDAIATARAAGLADGSAEMTTLVGSILHPKYGAWRRFDEFLPLNIQGMIAWRAGKSPSAH
jgi:glyoxylase-like metal-dependent hydrolase (beta-lactamase superfamily II)